MGVQIGPKFWALESSRSPVAPSVNLRVLVHLGLVGEVQESRNVEERFGTVVKHRQNDGNASEAVLREARRRNELGTRFS